MDAKGVIITTVIGFTALIFTPEIKHRYEQRKKCKVTREAEKVLDSLHHVNDSLAHRIRFERDSLHEVKQRIKWRVKVIQIEKKDSL